MSSSRIGVVVAAAATAIVFAPASVWAAAAFSDVALQDPGTGTQAHVDAAGHLLVAGARPLPPVNPWASVQRVSLVTPAGTPRQTTKPFTPPTTGGIQLTAVTVSIASADAGNWATVSVVELAPASGQTSCAATVDTAPRNLATLYQVTVSGGRPATVALPAPIQVHGVLALGPLCVGAQIVDGNASASVAASGYFGT